MVIISTHTAIIGTVILIIRTHTAIIGTVILIISTHTAIIGTLIRLSGHAVRHCLQRRNATIISG